MFYNLHTHFLNLNPEITVLLNQYPLEFQNNDNFFSIGIHPWKINVETLEDEFKLLEEKISFKNCLALGECGLDKAISIDFELQKEVFKRHLQISEKFNKPIVIHCVRAYQEILNLIDQVNPKQIVIFHGFKGSLELAQQILKKNHYLSFGKYLILNPELTEVFKEIPINKIFLETDTYEKSIQEIYEIASTIRKIPIEKLKLDIAENFKKLFL